MKTKGNLGFFAIMFLWLTIGIGIFSSDAFSAAFAIQLQGTKETALSTNAIAHTEGPASNYYNPALISYLEGTQFQAGVTYIGPVSSFQSSQTSRSAEAEKQNFFIPNLFATHRLDEKITVGLGVFTPFGLGTDWGKDWEGRYSATNGEVSTCVINPNISIKVTDTLAISAGVDQMLGEATFEQNIPLAAYGITEDGETRIEGDGDGHGYNIGLACLPVEDWSFGLSYRSQINLELDGKTTNSLPDSTPAILQPLLEAAIPPETNTTCEFILPPQASAGVCFQGIDRLAIELGLRWEGWSAVEQNEFVFDQPIAGNNSMVIEKHWRDTIAYNLGGKFNIDETLTLLAGYSKEENPVPSDWFEPIVMGMDKNVFAFGVNKDLDAFEVGASYYYEIYEDRQITADTKAAGTPAGEYGTEVYVVAVSASCKF
ncbi:MAG: outer membrane protein transport protein [Pseudomonadota bacterium]